MAKNPSLKNKLAAELIGTLFFVFVGAGSVVATYFLHMPFILALLFIALGNGLGLALAVSATMGVSGGNLNPAVTIGLFFADKIKASEAFLYIIVQVIGAVIGAALLLVFFAPAVGGAVFWGAPTLASSITVVQGIAIEAIMTFMLLLAVFGTAVDERAPKIGGFGIGLTVALDVIVGGALTGAAMNPARALGPAIVALNFTNWYVYWIGPIIGAVIAALIYKEFIMKK